ncbi:hypothetical protein FRC02_001606 [Tulasnella sp. 418]|nr:hypothetical protein FRC02_001606 [Tulasnella sp. 418]
MARTERAVHPRAIIKDRSESKSGMDKSMRKGGAGAHNWGSAHDQFDVEYYDEIDAEAPKDAARGHHAKVVASEHDVEDAEESPKGRRSSVSTTSTGAVSNITDEEREKALAFRTKALKNNDLDLAAIARTSGALSHSPPKGL